MGCSVWGGIIKGKEQGEWGKETFEVVQYGAEWGVQFKWDI